MVLNCPVIGVRLPSTLALEHLKGSWVLACLMQAGSYNTYLESGRRWRRRRQGMKRSQEMMF